MLLANRAAQVLYTCCGLSAIASTIEGWIDQVDVSRGFLYLQLKGVGDRLRVIGKVLHVAPLDYERAIGRYACDARIYTAVLGGCVIQIVPVCRDNAVGRTGDAFGRIKIGQHAGELLAIG